MDLGLEKAGFKVKVCIEKDIRRCQTIEKNRSRWNPMCADIRQLSTEEILRHASLSAGEVGLVSGGPPCQPFSKSAFWVPRRLEHIVESPRARLLREFIRVVREVKPAAYIMENVHGLAFKPSRPVLDMVLSRLKGAGYSTNPKVVNAADYGVPQKRHRLFIIGAKDGVELTFPTPTHSDNDLEGDTEKKPYVTAGQAIADLDDGVVKKHEMVGGKWGHLLPKIPPGENYLFLTEKGGHPNPKFKWRSRYWSFLLKLSPDQPSWTIQARPGPYVGPFHWRDRRLRISEIKRLQTFPDDWVIVGDRNERWAQIGDAVPHLLAWKIGESMLEQLVQAGLVEHAVTG